MISNWPELRDFTLGLQLPEVTLDHPHGHESLKAFDKLWCHWSPYADGGVFKASRDACEMLMQVDPGTFFLHPHYANHDYVLVRAGRKEPAWAKAKLIDRWRENAPKRFLKDWDARHDL